MAWKTVVTETITDIAGVEKFFTKIDIVPEEALDAMLEVDFDAPATVDAIVKAYTVHDDGGDQQTDHPIWIRRIVADPVTANWPLPMVFKRASVVIGIVGETGGENMASAKLRYRLGS